jgi:hypothetical protein
MVDYKANFSEPAYIHGLNDGVEQVVFEERDVSPLDETAVYRGTSSMDDTVVYRGVPSMDQGDLPLFPSESPWGQSSSCEGGQLAALSPNPLLFSAVSESGTTVPVPDCPAYWEHNSSWISLDPVEDIVKYCEEAMQSQGVDFRLISAYHMKGIVYGDSADMTTFKLRIYKAPAGQRGHLVELQRRDGSVLTFRRFYNKFTDILGVAPKSERQHLSRSVAELEDGMPLSAGTIETMMSLASSKYIEQVREGMAFFACASDKAHNRPKILALPFIHSIIAQSLASGDPSCTRSSSLVLENLLPDANRDFCQLAATHLLQPILTVLLGPDKLETLDSKRCLARCLLRLAQFLPAGTASTLWGIIASTSELTIKNPLLDLVEKI